MAVCREAVISDAYKGFGVANRGSEEEVARLLRADCVRRVSDNLAFAYFYYPEPEQGGREFPFGIMQKCYGLLSEEELAASGVLQLREGPLTSFYGSGVLLGFIDTGIEFADNAFRNADGSTRLVGLWDQTLEGEPSGMEISELEQQGQSAGMIYGLRGETTFDFAFYGSEFSEEEINRALQTENPYTVIPSRDENGHGSALVRAAAASEMRAGRFPLRGAGVAPLASIAMVKLKQAKPYLRDFYQIPESAFCVAEEDIIYGIEWLLSVARRESMPLVLCIALGSNQGNHTGQTVLSGYLNQVSQIPGVCVCTAAGNEGGTGHHFFGRVQEDGYEEVEINVAEGEEGFSVELWAVDPDLFTLELISPGGEVIPRIQGRPTFNRQYRLYFEGGTIWIQSNLYDQSVGTQGIWIRFAGTAPGVWRIRVYGEGEFSKSFHMWLPMKNFLREETAFLRPDPYVQVCDPGAAREVLTFTAYDVISGSLYREASYGYTADNRIKPDLAAPKGEVLYEGTGMGTAFGAGCAALVFEAAIRREAYVILDTLVMKRLFTASAKRNGRDYPNREWGYGKLDVYGVFVRSPGRTLL
ncbi:MAG: S8 family peptidase [Lachnospiraceae bacterium]|nr:S8 family peptidase [Lachnospiraceae bacterium]